MIRADRTEFDRAVVAALAGFEHMTTQRLNALLTGRPPAEAYALASGEMAPAGGVAAMFERWPDLRGRWNTSAREITPERMGEWCTSLDVQIVVPGDPGFPAQLLDDPRRPAVLFVQGDPAALHGRRIGIVGTRNPTRRGSQIAARFGHELASVDVVVVSGLALGIDGSAHRGALGASGAAPVAVVANGHDHPYPRRHAALWNEIAERGAVISEWPPGTKPEPFRFPQRNRILAALSEVLVVIESRERGGSLITAREAAERGIDVFAVPGPIDERACTGTNALLYDGAAPAASTDVLLAALGLDSRRAGTARFDPRARPNAHEQPVLDLCCEAAQTVESVAERLGCGLGEAAMSLARLERSGWLAEVGGWFEAIDEYGDLT